MKYSAHHLLFYRKRFNKGYAHRLRKAFVYEIPDKMHIALHQIVGPVPAISEDEARRIFVEYKRLDHELDIYEALNWLILNAPTAEFAMAIMAQLGFIRNYEATHND